MIDKQAKISKRFLRALSGHVTDRPPFWLMRQAGRYLPEYQEIRATAKNFLAFCYTPDLAVEVTLQPLRRYGMDAAILFSDILVIPDALGQKVTFETGEGPVLEPIRSRAAIKRLDIGRMTEHLQPVFESLRILRRELNDETALIGFAGAPWTIALYMVEGRGGTEGTTIRKWAYEAPEDLQVLIDLIVETTADYLCLQIENGAEAVQIFDSWAGIVSESQFRRWVIEPNRKIVEKVHQVYPGAPIIGFPRNAGALYRDFVEQTGVDAVSIDHGVPLEWARDVLQKTCTVQGNLDNHVLLVGGAALDDEVDRILEILSPKPFVFNLGHGVLPPTPPENVERVAERIRRWKS